MTYSSEARSALSSDPLAARSGGHHGGQYKKQSQPAKHENFLNVAAIEFDGHLSLPPLHNSYCKHGSAILTPNMK
jgi:hypothetical protein